MASKRLDIFLNAHDRATKGIGRVSRGLRGLVRRITSIPALIGGALGGVAFGAFVKQAVEAFGVQEKAVASLRQALIDAGDAGAASQAQIEGFAASLQQVTTQGDEATIALSAYIAGIGNLTGNALVQATQATLGLARATGQGQQIMARALLNAIQGNFSMLERYIPALRSATDETEKMALVQGLAAKGLNLMASDANTTSGAIQQMKNAFGDTLEVIGGLFAPAIRSVTELLKGLAQFIQTKFVRDFRSGLQAIVELLEPWREQIQAAVIAVQFSFENFADITALAMITAAKSVVDFRDTVVFAFEQVVGVLGWLSDNWRSILTDLFTLTTTVFKNLASNIVAVIRNIPDLITGDAGFDDLWTPLANGFEATLKELPKIVQRNQSDLSKSLEEMIRQTKDSLGRSLDETIRRSMRQSVDQATRTIRDSGVPGLDIGSIGGGAGGGRLVVGGSSTTAGGASGGGGSGGTGGSGGAGGGGGFGVAALRVTDRFRGLADQARQRGQRDDQMARDIARMEEASQRQTRILTQIETNTKLGFPGGNTGSAGGITVSF